MTDRLAQSRCPRLGLSDERNLYCLFVSPAHRCYRGAGAHGIPEKQQADYCLRARHHTCRHFAVSPKLAKDHQKRFRYRAMLLGVLLLTALGATAIGVASAAGGRHPTSAIPGEFLSAQSQ